MSTKSSTYCFCESARFTGGYLAKPCADVIEISLKFEKCHDKDDANSIHNNSTEKCNLNFLELSHKSLNEVCTNVQVHHCVSELIQHVLLNRPLVDAKNTSPTVNETPDVKPTTNVTVHQATEPEIPKSDTKESGVAKRNSSLRSMKSARSMEMILEKKSSARLKEKSPDESKAKSVSHLNDDEEGEEYIENGESIELIFISDEFVNKVQRQDQEVIILDDKDGRRRDSLTGNKKIVIITDEWKHKVLRNNSIVVTNEKKMLKKVKRAKTYNTNSNSYLPYDEPDEPFVKMESKKIDANV